MRKNVLKIALASAILFSNGMPLLAQSANNWQPISEKQYEFRRIHPNKYLAYKINLEELKSFLNSLPEDYNNAKIIALPNPDGTFEEFSVWKSSTMEKELQDKYSEIQTFSGVSVNNPFRTIKLDYTLYGFHAMILDDGNTYFIDPIDFNGGNDYQVYYKSDYQRKDGTKHPCLVDDDFKTSEALLEPSIGESHTVVPMAIHGNTKKTYRLALACTGEYAAAVTGTSFPTKAAVLSAMVTSVNRVNGIYEKEMSIKMNLIANNDAIIYTLASSDPYYSNFNGAMLLSENHNNLQTVIGTSNYDIGHIFSTGGGGIASLGSVCASTRKGQGVTGLPEPYGDSYDVDYVAHEMGHQFGANHTFNNCGGNENYNTAYEPGSGSTIMAYAGICPPGLNLQNNSNDYFHPVSLLEISSFVNGSSIGGVGATCGTSTPSHPSITFGYPTRTFVVPANTAFELEAPTATWSVSSNLKYNWEQWDLGTLGVAETTGATKTSGPVFRSYPVTAFNNKFRSFPHADSVHKNKYNFVGERTPTVTRTLKIKGLVKGIGPDGYGVWNIADNSITINMTNTGTPFQVSAPNTGSEVWTTNAYNNVTWNVANTNTAPINAANVDVLLSKDGGATYPHVIASNIPNTGSANVFVPYGMATTKARIKVKGYNNAFYDVSNLNFRINEGPASINNEELSKHFSIYPNPAYETLNIENLNKANNVSIKISNILGQEFINTTINNNKSVIDISSLANGVYVITLINEEGTQYTSKFVKQ